MRPPNDPSQPLWPVVPRSLMCHSGGPYPNSYPNQLGATISIDEQTSRSAGISGYPNMQRR